MTAFTVQAPGHGGAVITLTAPTTGSVDTVPTGAGMHEHFRPGRDTMAPRR